MTSYQAQQNTVTLCRRATKTTLNTKREIL